MNINRSVEKIEPGKRVLVAPLDWGLGHATRCIPIIRILIQFQAQVWIAADGPIANLLKSEFPNIQIIPLAGYRVTYSGNPSLFFLQMLKQVPSILSNIQKENRLLKKMVSDYKIDLVISDNRYGFHHPNCHSVFITHQLSIKTGFSVLDSMIQKINYHFINRFSVCWIPDIKEQSGLSGELSHPEKMPKVPVRYLGLLSRFSPSLDKGNSGLLFLISGPEPQRTHFENIILSQLEKTDKKITLVRGLPGSPTELTNAPQQVTIYNHLVSEELAILIKNAAVVVARSGYSTVMDLVALQKKAILVPTPGQTEQEYLATFLKESKVFYSVNQHQLDLSTDISRAENFTNKFPECQGALEKIVLEALLHC